MNIRRTVLSLTLVVTSVCLGGCESGPRNDPKARDAAEWVVRRGGTVRLVDVPKQVSDLDGLPEGPFAIEEIDLNSLPVNQPPVRDDELKVLEGLTNLRSLGLYGSDVTDRGAEIIAGLRTLRELELSQTQITDQGLETLAALPDLETVFLRNAGEKVTDDGVKNFERRTGARVFR